MMVDGQKGSIPFPLVGGGEVNPCNGIYLDMLNKLKVIDVERP